MRYGLESRNKKGQLKGAYIQKEVASTPQFYV